MYDVCSNRPHLATSCKRCGLRTIKQRWAKYQNILEAVDGAASIVERPVCRVTAGAAADAVVAVDGNVTGRVVALVHDVWSRRWYHPITTVR